MDNLQTQGIRLPRLGLGTFRLQGDALPRGGRKRAGARLSPYRHR